MAAATLSGSVPQRGPPPVPVRSESLAPGAAFRFEGIGLRSACEKIIHIAVDEFGAAGIVCKDMICHAHVGGIFPALFIPPVGTLHDELQADVPFILRVLPHGDNQNLRGRVQGMIPEYFNA